MKDLMLMVGLNQTADQSSAAGRVGGCVLMPEDICWVMNGKVKGANVGLSSRGRDWGRSESSWEVVSRRSKWIVFVGKVAARWR